MRDWLTLARTARAFTRERIEDYVAAATAGGPLMPDVGRSGQREAMSSRCRGLSFVARRAGRRDGRSPGAGARPTGSARSGSCRRAKTRTSAARRCCGRASSRPSGVTGLTFFVNGRQACALTQLPFECEWDAGPAIAEHQVRAVATLKGGGRLVQTVRTKSVGYTERVDVDVVQVTVTVSDERGRFVRDIPQSAFHVLEDGHPQAITHFASEDVPLELVVAIDISGSMAPAMPRLKTAVKGFLGDVPPQDQVTLLGFNDNIFTLTRKTTDPAERIKAVDRLAPWGSTALYDVHPARRRDARPPDRPQGAGRVQRRRRSGQPRHDRRRRAAAAVERRDALHDRRRAAASRWSR